ncbi:helix-turn-helix domain-containing protein [Streptomyces sp. NBC_00623]|uniref:helix-turn-helix domain-containing protein n=1 Tax=Streptomyces sp. NBC_00623 TaxID=2975790 RepID=UPI00386A669A
MLAELQRELIGAHQRRSRLCTGPRPGRRADRSSPRTRPRSPAQRLYAEREKTVQQIADVFGVPRSTVYGHLDKAKKGQPSPAR